VSREGSACIGSRCPRRASRTVQVASTGSPSSIHCSRRRAWPGACAATARAFHGGRQGEHGEKSWEFFEGYTFLKRDPSHDNAIAGWSMSTAAKIREGSAHALCMTLRHDRYHDLWSQAREFSPGVCIHIAVTMWRVRCTDCAHKASGPCARNALPCWQASPTKVTLGTMPGAGGTLP
jgi:hypothetical protein